MVCLVLQAGNEKYDVLDLWHNERARWFVIILFKIGIIIIIIIIIITFTTFLIETIIVIQ
jgi:hypothetical protein